MALQPINSFDNLYLARISDLELALNLAEYADNILLPLEQANTLKIGSLGDLKDWILTNPVFIGIGNVPTPAPGNNTTQIANTQFVTTALTGLGLGTATASTTGTVRTNATDANPTVYLKATVDTLLNTKANLSNPVFTGTISSQNLSLGGTLGVSGLSTLAGLIAQNTTVNGTLAASGACTFGATLNVAGALTVNSGSITNTLIVGGAGTFTGLLTGNQGRFNQNLEVYGSTTLQAVTATFISSSGLSTFESVNITNIPGSSDSSNRGVNSAWVNNWGNRDKVIASKSTISNSATVNQYINLTGFSEQIDNDNIFDSANGILTIRENGYYTVSMNATVAAIINTAFLTNVVLAINVNGNNEIIVLDQIIQDDSLLTRKNMNGVSSLFFSGGTQLRPQVYIGMANSSGRFNLSNILFSFKRF
jgi:hypothetical protein